MRKIEAIRGRIGCALVESGCAGHGAHLTVLVAGQAVTLDLDFQAAKELSDAILRASGWSFRGPGA